MVLLLCVFVLFAHSQAKVQLVGHNEPFEQARENQGVAIDFVPVKTVNHDKMLFHQLSKFKQTTHSQSVHDYFKEWRSFKTRHGKIYVTFEEEKNRFKTFIANFEHVHRHNVAYKLNLKTYKTQLNQFSDMTHEEFVRTMNGFKRELGDAQDKEGHLNFRSPLNFEAPSQVDWREHGFVTPVKNQGHCGSCWAFSATGSLEGQHKRKSGKLVSLSEQNLVDCSFKFGNEGCNGGLMDNAFQYIKQNKGVDTEMSYPYEAKDGKCRFKKTTIGADDIGFVDVKSGNETALRDALASQGPISVAIDAGHKSFQFYKEGVYFEPKCSSEDLDHGVLAVGYGTTEDGQDYWIIKNSWGTVWGEDGYLRIARNRENQCGVATQASYPSV